MALASNQHITLIATISTHDAPVKPFIIYSGMFLLEEWVITQDEKPEIIAMVSELGWINGFLALRWLTDCFDPATQD